MEVGQRVIVGAYCGGSPPFGVQSNELLFTSNHDCTGDKNDTNPSSTCSINNDHLQSYDQTNECPLISTTSQTKTTSISAAKLAELLGDHNPTAAPIAILDCRPISVYRKGHCKQAEHVLSPPTLLYHRMKGKPDFWSSIRQRLVIPDYNENGQASTVVLIDDDHQDEENVCASPGAGRSSGGQRANTSAQQSFTSYLLSKLRIEGCITYFLEKGAMARFLVDYPDLCVFEPDVDNGGNERDGNFTSALNDSKKNGISSPKSFSRRQSPISSTASPFFLPILKLKNLNLQQDSTCTSDSTGDETKTACSSKDGQTSDLSGDATSSIEIGSKSANDRDPVNIYATLYLGNAEHARDLEILRRYNIQYILNVTSDLPNEFENSDNKEESFKYLRIPIVDNVSSNLASYFPMANEFIDRAIQEKVGVLIHCLAGISRSVTFTVAYLMKAKSYGLEEAFDLVKKRKPNIEPNLNFMSQLLAYERTILRSDLGSGGVTPDSAVSSLSTSSSSSICADSVNQQNEPPCT